ncbi:hypothetical protein AB0B25_25320 [Nocardia sp. NPDC049190]|uniref:hypothetical protein n=1 Tax=Nocardia sp. NPDC049190 TaxID=3155650 RepID=UPI0033FBA6A5
MDDRADRAQAKVFFDLLVEEADELSYVIETMNRAASTGPAARATQLRLLRIELHEVLRCITQIRRRFPGVSVVGSLSAVASADRSEPRKGKEPVSTRG